jgi:hypothetical protein
MAGAGQDVSESDGMGALHTADRGRSRTHNRAVKLGSGWAGAVRPAVIPVSVTQTSFIEISIEAGILRSGKGAIHASVGLLSAVVFLAQNWYGISVSSLRMQLSQWLVTAVVS